MNATPITPSQIGFRPGRPWSLLDMLKLKANEFLSAVTRITELRSHLSVTGKSKSSAFHSERELEDVDRIFVSGRLEKLVGNLEKLATPVTLETTKDAQKLVALAVCKWKDVVEALDDIDRTLHRELRSVTLLSLTADEGDLFEPLEPLFGDEVYKAFHSARFDISEAGKCLALDRGTACVFHLMRALEAPMRCLLREIGIEPQPSWNTSLNKFDSALGEIQQRLTQNSAEKLADWKEKEKFYSEASALLRNVKNAWRNETNHLEEKYTVEEANRIFNSVDGLSQFLASRLSEPSSEQSP